MEKLKIADPNFPLIQLPGDFDTRRITRRGTLKPGEEIEIINVNGPGCIRHFWLTFSLSNDIELEIKCDKENKPQVKMKLNQFFGVLLGQKPYRIESAPIKLLPKSGYNCYLPIPFNSSCRIVIRNSGKSETVFYSMANWHCYDKDELITPYRLHANYRVESPAPPQSSYLVGDVSGRGFIAGLFKGIRKHDQSDLIYHTGSDLWMIDGEVNPHVMRGIGIEDTFGQSFGFFKDNSQWSGCPYEESWYGNTATEGVVYRFFGVDTVAFKSSLILRFGALGNHTESVLYTYLDREYDVNEVESPKSWTLIGPFDCHSIEDFEKEEFAERARTNWLENREWGDRLFPPIDLDSEHTWIDFTRYFRCTNQSKKYGMQLDHVSAYAHAIIATESQCKKIIRLGFDDWLKLWINGKPVTTLRHDNGFALQEVPVLLEKGNNEILIKLSNFDNIEWRCWAFSLIVGVDK